MTFATDHRLPNFVLTHRQAVLEKGVDSQVPLVVTNLETAVLQAHPLRLSKSTLQNFTFDTRVSKAPPRETLYQTEKQLDRKGEAVCRFSVGDTQILYGRLMVESAVRDDRGKSIAGRAHADFAARDRFVGIRRLPWTMEAGKPADLALLVVDGRKNPVSNTPIKVTLSRMETKAARVKGAGNAYVTHYTHQWVPVSEQTVTSGLNPVKCTLTPQKPGSHRVTATIKDTHGRIHATHILQWAVGKGHVVWEESPDNRLTLIPEKDVFEVGKQARYLIKNPFPGAMALVSIEWYGILKHWVQPLKGSTPTIEFQVEPDFLPGFYLSVVVVSPRVDQPPMKPGDVDLGKPCFRMGYAKARVTDPHNQMVVTVTPEQPIYKPRDLVRIKLKAAASVSKGSAPVEMAVVVLDESVFDLISGGLDYFDPYMAVTPGNRMGLGDGTFKVNQPTEIRPVMPNQVTAGDRFEAGFSIMNRTARNRHLSVTLTARGPVKTSGHENILKKSVQILLPPYRRELRHDAARFYSEYLPAGNYHLSCTAQVIAPGDFTVLPVHAEEMYNPDVFGKGVTDQLVVSVD